MTVAQQIEAAEKKLEDAGEPIRSGNYDSKDVDALENAFVNYLDSVRAQSHRPTWYDRLKRALSFTEA